MTLTFKKRFAVVTSLVAMSLGAATGWADDDDDDDGGPNANATMAITIDGPPPPVAPAVVARDAEGRMTLRATRLDEPLSMDGRLDERIYADVPSVDGFVQQEPLAGQPATEDTEVWVFYDQSNFYVSARLHDSKPERMIANEMRRDNRNIENQNESFAVILDTFYDRRNGFVFRTNPLGALGDAQVTDERNVNNDWNTVWYVKTGRNDSGWTLEMAIPFKSLRYRAGASQIWGINFQRRVKWKNERTFLTPIPAAFDREGLLKLSFAATLVGVEAPARSIRLELKPYTTASVATNLNADVPFENDGDAGIGFDAKYGVTKGLTLDFTYNTDFAQVEDDESQVNLTRFSLFFPEKREFFLEGQGIFNFGGRDTRAFSFDGPADAPVMFFSRRIGLNSGAEVPITVGGRMTGRAGRYSIGLLNIATDETATEDGFVPTTNFSVVRIKRDIFRRSNIGFITTYRNNNSDETGNNVVGGVDGNFTFYDNLNVNTYVAKSDTPGLDGGDLTYRGAVKYDADLRGFDAEYLLLEDDFNPDIGFIRRGNIRKMAGGARYSIRPRGIKAIRKVDFEGGYDYYERASTSLVETKTAEAEFRARMEAGDFVNVTVNRNTEVLFNEFEITDDVFLPVGEYTFNRIRGGVWFSGHRKLSGWVGAETGGFFGGTRTELTWRGRIEVTPQFSLEPNLSLNWIDVQQTSFRTDLIRLRGTYTISPRSFVGALVQYNSEANALTTNIRFRWEYQPGSDVFFVYSDGRDTLATGYPALENRSLVFKFTRLFRF